MTRWQDEVVQTDPVQVETVEAVQEVVRSASRLLVRGGGSKPALSTPAAGETTLLDLSRLRKVLVYEPAEFTFTAQAGAPVREIAAMLAEKGQYLPFDPPLVDAGATLGGVVAAGTSGPGRYRYGSIRDFLIGIRFVDGAGTLVQGGGKVVKNAAGFDFPKLMVGSLGRLGILTEVTFKVFPAPQAMATVCADFAKLDHALQALVRLTRSQFDLDALDLAPTATGFNVWVRIGGLSTALPNRLEQLSLLFNKERPPRQLQLFQAESPNYWAEYNSMAWLPSETMLVKVPVTPKRVHVLDPLLADHAAERRYSAGGNTAWIAWPGTPDELHALLRQCELAGVLLVGPAGRPWLGTMSGKGFLQRIAATLDSDNKFGALTIWP